MAQAQHEDEELAQLIRSYLKRLERALERALRQAQQEELRRRAATKIARKQKAAAAVAGDPHINHTVGRTHAPHRKPYLTDT